MLYITKKQLVNCMILTYENREVLVKTIIFVLIYCDISTKISEKGGT